MKMKHGIGVLTAVVLAAVFCWANDDTFAQEKDKGGDKKPKGNLPAGWAKLNLSAKQKADIYAVKATYSPKIKALEMQIKDLKEGEHKEMVKLLTEDQKKQLAASIGLEVPKSEDKKPDTKPEIKK
jgi:hypothetical protein